MIELFAPLVQKEQITIGWEMTMYPQEKLFGFDVREMWKPFKWTRRMKNMHLLRHDLEKVLSTDRYVWPNVFDISPELVEYPFPSRNFRSVYDSVEIITQYLTKGWQASWKPSWIIAITVILEYSEQESHLEMPYISILKPDLLSPDWEFVGYDISDPSLLSGLSDCGYARRERKGLRKRWSPFLNKYHLFTDLEQATEFRKLTDKRVPEHAPFTIYGIYSVKKHGF